MKKNVKRKRPAKNKKLYGIEGSRIAWGRARGKGRGVFTTRRIKKGEIVEIAPVIPIGKKAVPDDVPPDGWVLDWDEDTKGREYAIVMGYVMLYNHSEHPNIELESDLDEMTVTAIAIRDISPGEELTWDYACEIWFEDGA